MTLRWPFARRTLHTSNAGSSPADAAGQPWPKRVDLHVVAFGVELPPRRRLWLQIGRILEVRLYWLGVELLVGPVHPGFLAIEAGTEGFGAMIVRARANDRFLKVLRDHAESRS